MGVVDRRRTCITTTAIELKRCSLMTHVTQPSFATVELFVNIINDDELAFTLMFTCVLAHEAKVTVVDVVQHRDRVVTFDVNSVRSPKAFSDVVLSAGNASVNTTLTSLGRELLETIRTKLISVIELQFGI